jgi:uncharacterized protein YdcH (DUF465 family)
MFPEYRDLISRLKNSDRRFERLFEKHNELDHKIANIEAGNEIDTSVTVEQLKKEKLKLKDEIYTILKKHDAQEK